MRPGPLSSIIYGTCKTFGLVSLWLVLLVGIIGLNLTPNENLGPTVVKCHVWVIDNSKWLIPGLTVVAGFCKGIMTWVGAPRHWETVRTILEFIQKEVFKNIPSNEFSEDHRVTLYRFRRFALFPGWRNWFWPWGYGNHPWSGWLIPLVRGGTKKKSKTVFLAHANEGDKFEGIAGATMLSQHKVLLIQDLPDVNASQKPQIIDQYAKDTYVSRNWLLRRISKGRLCSRSFYSIRIEVNGKDWGVLMIDSRLENLPNPRITPHVFESIHAVLEILLSRKDS